MPRAVIFDVDGTLVDTNGLHEKAWLATFKHFHLPGNFDDLRQHLGKGADQLMPAFIDPEVLRQRGAEIERYRAELYAREYLPRIPFVGVLCGGFAEQALVNAAP